MKKLAILALCILAGTGLYAQQIRTNYRSEGMTHISTDYEDIRIDNTPVQTRVELVGFPDGSTLYLLYLNLVQKEAVVVPKGVKMAITLQNGKIVRLEQIGQGRFVRGFFRVGRSQSAAWYPAEVVEAVIDATYVMAQNRTGALIVLEREISLTEYIKTGIRLDAVVSSALLINIFEHNTPLHDGAVIMQGEKVTAATCYLPLSQNMAIGKELGTRHRAAIGLSEETDSWVIVVSEETGQVSLAKRGELAQNLRPDELRNELMMIETEFQRSDLRKAAEKGASRRKKADKKQKAAKGGKQDAE